MDTKEVDVLIKHEKLIDISLFFARAGLHTTIIIDVQYLRFLALPTYFLFL
jgi:hypothetical protein